MKKAISVSLLLAMFSCATITPVTNTNTNGSACQHPQYIVTVAKLTGTTTEVPMIYTLTKEAQTNYGSDVTIQNIRYDKVKGKVVAVVYDIIKCDTLRK